jgi:hypothetical protein
MASLFSLMTPNASALGPVISGHAAPIQHPDIAVVAGVTLLIVLLGLSLRDVLRNAGRCQHWQ